MTADEYAEVVAWLYALDAAVVEVGLGGRLDATNVVNPAVSVITTIGLDHEEFLGNTVASVAHEKAGIIKPGRPVIIGKVTEDIRAMLVAIAGERGAPAFCWGHDFSTDRPLPNPPPWPEMATGEGTQRTTNATFQFSGMGVDLADVVVG